MTSARLHTDGTHSDATPTESMVSLPVHDACQPRAHKWREIHSTASSILLSCTECGARTNNAFLADIHGCPGDDTTRIVLPGPLADPVPRVLPACDDCGDRDDIEKCHVAGVARNPETGRMQCVDCLARWIDADMATWIPRVNHNGNSSPKGVAFMSPEVLREKLRACYPHYCRSIGCGNTVEHCGDHCPRCVSEIEALRKQYVEQDRRPIPWSAVIKWSLIFGAVVGVAVFLMGCSNEPAKPDTRPKAVAQSEEINMGNKTSGQVLLLPTGERILVVSRWYEQGGNPPQYGVAISTTLLPDLKSVEAK